MEINIQLKQAGRRKNEIVTIPFELEAVPHTVEELLCFTVRACIREFEIKQEAEPPILKEEEIQDRASAGKVAFGFFYGNAAVKQAEALQSAIEAFEDGIVAIFIDNRRYEGLNEKIEIGNKTLVTFVKLTMLAGRLW